MSANIIRTFLFACLLINTYFAANAQSLISYADSIRKLYQIPALGYAVVTADNIIESKVLGVRRVSTNYYVKSNDKFHIGSNTKAITAYLAALLVQQGQLKWDTNFFDLFPELREKSKEVYHTITLQDLLTMRGKLPAYSYNSEKPSKKQIKGEDIAAQRYQLAQYFLSQKPQTEENGLTLSNADYILAGLMIEKASGKSYEQLLNDLGDLIDAKFGFNYPNTIDTLQPYGHDIDLNIVPPGENYKLNWLLTAGNINVSLPDYSNFIQLQLIGLKGESDLLSAEVYNQLLFGLPVFSFGWFTKVDSATQHHIAYNTGNAGAFITQVEIIKEIGKGYIIFTNSATTKTSEGVSVLMDELKRRYEK
ncbi:MAG: serine hydrolase domain-containing protein [Chitinophagales bacterium]